MKIDFIHVKTAFGDRTIARSSIALVEPIPYGCKITLNLKDDKGKEIVILTTESQAQILAWLSQV